MRLASRPARAGSSRTVPWNRRGLRGAGAAGIVSVAPRCVGPDTPAGGLPLSLRLPLLMRVEIERLLLGQDRLPRQKFTHRLVQILKRLRPNTSFHASHM